MPRLEVKEKQIENQILSHLKQIGIFCFKVESQGTYDQAKRIYRKNISGHHMRGVADILGIYNGKFLAIEVKSKTGKTSEHQELFLREVYFRGGIAIVARSIEDVMNALEKKNE